MSPEATRLYCGFCAKSQDEVDKLIAGPGVHICNECVDMCHAIVHPAPPPGEPSSEKNEPGWAEAVAAPDEDIGFVFTPLGPEETGLPVRIAIGDDTPLVIVGEPAWDIMPLARRWVIRNAKALEAHWQGEIGSPELLARLLRLS